MKIEKPYIDYDIAVLCPSRHRNRNHLRLALNFFERNPSRSILVFGLDADDEAEYLRVNHPRIRYEVFPRVRCAQMNNLLAAKYAPLAAILAPIGDDHLFRSPDWEQKVWAAHEAGGNIIVCRDGRFDDGLPANYFVASRIVKALGFLSPPCLEHLCADNFLRDLGREIGGYVYLPDVFIEHLHYMNHKSEMDDTYRECNSDEQYRKDCGAWDAYQKAGHLLADIQRVKNALVTA